MEMIFAPKNVLRYPRLDTMLMVEKAAYKAKGDLTVVQLWRKLPKQVMWQTYLLILDYLQEGGKLVIDKDKHVIWIWDPKGVEDLKKRGLVYA